MDYGYYISASNGGYYEGDKIEIGDLEVPQRPDQWATWDGQKWLAGSPPPLPPEADPIEQLKSLLNDPRVKSFLALS